MLHVGLDLTSVPARTGGVSLYLSELTAALGRIGAGQRYSLIVNRRRARQWDVNGARADIVPVDLPSRPIRLAWEQLMLPAHARRLGLDVLHSPHYTRPLARLPCASVVGIMDMTFFLIPQQHTFAKRVFFRTAIRQSVRRADRLLAISESTGLDMQRCLGVAPERIDVTPLAVSRAYRPDQDPAQLQKVRVRHALPERYILFVGRLEPRKNLLRLLDAYESVARRQPSTTPRLVLAGARGWHSAPLEEKLAALGPRVQVLGHVEDDDLPGLYAGAMLFVYPSLYEGFGLPVLEALSCGIPAITSNISSLPEVAGDAAELVDPLRTESIEDALERLIADEDRRTDLRGRGLRRAAQFSWERTARLTADAYERAFDQWRRKAR